eukprot:386577-Rhodomonas_salina.1
MWSRLDRLDRPFPPFHVQRGRLIPVCRLSEVTQRWNVSSMLLSVPVYPRRSPRRQAFMSPVRNNVVHPRDFMCVMTELNT